MGGAKETYSHSDIRPSKLYQMQKGWMLKIWPKGYKVQTMCVAYIIPTVYRHAQFQGNDMKFTVYLQQKAWGEKMEMVHFPALQLNKPIGQPLRLFLHM